MQPTSAPPDPGVCENCATVEEELTPVWPAGDQSAGQPQLWCPECVARDPNEPAEDENDDGEGEDGEGRTATPPD